MVYDLVCFILNILNKNSYLLVNPRLKNNTSPPRPQTTATCLTITLYLSCSVVEKSFKEIMSFHYGYITNTATPLHKSSYSGSREKRFLKK